MSIFSEVRLQPSSSCRAWMADHGCFTAVEWEREVANLGAVREGFEHRRFAVSEALSVEGIDPLGVVRRLLIHESASPLSRAWLREVGFVHLEAASGIHLYAAARAFEFALARVAARDLLPMGVIRILRTAVPLLLWCAVFGLAGFRPGLIRPLALVGMRWAGSRFGFRWSRAVPIFVALTFDAAIGFFTSFGSGVRFSDWAPGELHYALAWWGGILGYEWARERGLGAFRAHACLSVASWLTVLPLDLAAGRFSPATPLLSLLTVEFLARGGYLVLLAGVWFPEALQWASLFLSRGVGWGADALSGVGALREIPDGTSLAMGYLMGFLVLGVSLRGGIAEKEGKPSELSGVKSGT